MQLVYITGKEIDLRDSYKPKIRKLFNKELSRIQNTIRKNLKSRLSSGIKYSSLPYPSSTEGNPPNEQFGRLAKSIIIRSKGLSSEILQDSMKEYSSKRVLKKYKKSIGAEKVIYGSYLENTLNRPFFFPVVRTFLSKRTKIIRDKLFDIIKKDIK